MVSGKRLQRTWLWPAPDPSLEDHDCVPLRATFLRFALAGADFMDHGFHVISSRGPAPYGVGHLPHAGGKTPVACHEHGTTLSGFLPASWDHLVASYGTTRRVVRGELSARLFASDVMFVDVEVNSGGVQGGRRG